MKKNLSFYSFLLSEIIFSQSSGENKENLLSNYLLLISWGSLGILIFIFCWWVWKRDKRAFGSQILSVTDNLPEQKEKSQTKPINSDPPNETDKNYSISIDTANTIFKRLKKFEKDQKFLKKDITLTWVANHLNTNTKYLSETIKMHTNKNFNSYINGLRIGYITYMLYKNPEYREYKIISLAKECGYSSSQVFVIAFKKENGIPPSFFIANLKNNNETPEVSIQ